MSVVFFLLLKHISGVKMHGITKMTNQGKQCLLYFEMDSVFSAQLSVILLILAHNNPNSQPSVTAISDLLFVGKEGKAICRRISGATYFRYLTYYYS